jgi:16S rRNA processing protein RimM
LLEYEQFNGLSRSWRGTLEVQQTKPQGRFLAYHFKGFDSPEAARKINGVELQVLRSTLPEAEAGEYYWHDLIGLQVVTGSGVSLGNIVEMMETGANDVMIVDGDRRRWVPFILPSVVTEVDVAAGVCRVDWDPEF